MGIYTAEPYRFKAGTVTIDEPYEDKYLYETAAWSTTYALHPGTYDVYGRIEKDYSGERKIILETEEVPGIILTDNTPSMYGGVAYSGTKNPRDGQEVKERIEVTAYKVNEGKLKFDLEVPFIEARTIHGTHQVFKLIEDHPQMEEILKERGRHNFKEMLRLDSRESFGFDFEAAKENGFLDGAKLDVGLEMGPWKYRDVIRIDQMMRKSLGYGLDRFSIPLHDVSERYRGRSGDVQKIMQETIEELKKDYQLPEKKRHAGSDLSMG